MSAPAYPAAATALVSTLIKREDACEFITARICEVLAVEIANQQVLATAAGEDPALWAVKVYKERARAWECFLNNEANVRLPPLVNVWQVSDNVDPHASNTKSRQKYKGTWYLDVYAQGRARPGAGGGQVPADADAVAERNLGVRIVRGCVMAAENTYLQAQGVVADRMVAGREYFEPTVEDHPSPTVVAARLSLDVTYSEFSPQYVPDTLELASGLITTYDEASGEVLAAGVDVEYPLPAP